ncbi:MAG TPA: PrgI family protein [bacterium]|nr:PrgI family protein [bacterium]
MAQYVVPQFITVEDKILGPITVRQFLILLVDTGLMFVFYKLFDFTLFLALAIPVTGFMMILAFVRIGGQPFHFFLLSILSMLKISRVRVWQGNAKVIMDLDYAAKKEEEVVVKIKNFDASRISELSKTVDTGGKYKRP